MSSARALAGDSRYRRLFLARTVSNVGNGIMPIALAFGILALPEGSPTALSVVLAAQAVPLVLMLPLGGVIADRMGRARVIAVTDIILSVVVATIAVLFLTGAVTIALLVGLSFLSGVLNALWYPAFSGLVPVLVLSFQHVSAPHRSGESVLGDLRQGWRVFLSFRWVVVIVLAFSLIVMVLRGAEEVMGPVLALEEYGGARGWAVVLGMQSLGLLLGAFLASRVRVRRPMLFGMLAVLTLPVWLVSLALALPLWAVSLGSFAWGISIELFAVLWFTALHRNIPREALSRVGAYDAMGSLMFGPIGLALAGPLVTAVGLQAGFLIAAAIATTAIVGALASRSVREQRA